MVTKPSIWKVNVGIYGLYAIITIIITYPAITGIIYPYTIPGTGADIPQFLWDLWWVNYAVLTLGASPTFTQAIYHPLGGVLFMHSPFNELASITPQMWLGLTRTYSVLWFFSFPTAAFTTYLLAFHLTNHRRAAFVGGLIFSFSARHYAHATVHLNLLTIQWLPLYALSLFLLLKKPSFKRSALVAASLILAITSEYIYYLFYFVLPFTGLFIIYYGFAKHPTLRRPKFWMALLGAALTAFVLLVPLYKPLLDSRDEDFVSKTGVIKFSADLLAYVIPAQNHPLAPEFLTAPYQRISGNPAEQTVFLGYVALALALLGAVKAWNRTTRFWLLLGAAALIFSLGPVLNIYGDVRVTIEDVETYILMPYAFLVNLPFISALRAPARLSVTVQLAVAILAAFGLVALSTRWPKFWRRGGYLILGGLLLVESLYQFPLAMDDSTLTPPAIYQQITQENNSLAVLNIPLRQHKAEAAVPVKDIDGADMYDFMYYGAIHQHPIVGGKGARLPSAPVKFWDTTAVLRELMYPSELNSSPEVLAADYTEFIKQAATLLARHAIGYVVIDRELLNKYYDEAVRSKPEAMLQQALGAPFYNDGRFVGFRVPQNTAPLPPAAPAVMWGDGWYPQSSYGNRPVRWMAQTGTLFVYAPAETQVQLAVTAFAPVLGDMAVTVTVNDVPVNTFQVSPPPAPPQTHLVPAISLMPGQNIVQFQVQPVERPEEWPDRRVYLGLYNITWQPGS